MSHTHKYRSAILGGEKVIVENGKKKLLKTGGYPIFRCILPNCSHYVPRKLALGRLVLCWVCGNVMEMKSYNLNEARPHHKECRK